MVDLPVDDRGLPARRSPPGTRIDGQADQFDQQRSGQVADQGHHPGQDAQESGCRRVGLLRPARPRPADRPRRSTAASSTYAAQHSDSETSPTTSPDHCPKSADSDPNYALNCEEPLILDLDNDYQAQRIDIWLSRQAMARTWETEKILGSDADEALAKARRDALSLPMKGMGMIA